MNLRVKKKNVHTEDIVKN